MLDTIHTPLTMTPRRPRGRTNLPPPPRAISSRSDFRSPPKRDAEHAFKPKGSPLPRPPDIVMKGASASRPFSLTATSSHRRSNVGYEVHVRRRGD